MDYLEQMRALQRVEDYKAALRDKISVSEGTARKLNPYYFLSAEVAGYKLLTHWDKVPQEDTSTLLDVIERLVNEDYADFDEYETEISMPLWEALTRGYEGAAYADLNNEVFLVATIAELKNGTPPDSTLGALMVGNDLIDPLMVSYAYSLAHDFLISQGPQFLERFAEMGIATPNLHRLHFKLFT